jgi:hypothetical protein
MQRAGATPAGDALASEVIRLGALGSATAATDAAAVLRRSSPDLPWV